VSLTTPLTLHDLIDASPDAILVVDVAGAIILVNRRAEHLLGYTRDELLGRPFTILVAPATDDLVPGVQVLRDSARSLTTHDATPTVEVVAQRKDGSLVPVEVSLNGLETGARKLVVAAVRDISQRKRMELERLSLLARERSARAEAEAAVQLRDAFLATVTHDLKQPLTNIHARAQVIDELAAELEPGQTSAQIRRLADRIVHTSSEMADVLAELLEVSRLQLGQPLELERTPTDITALARRVVDELHLAEGQSIHLQLPAEPLIGFWDEQRLERVLRNLLGNALKYSRGTGHVTLSARRDADALVVDVTDDGIGIPPGELDGIFAWFRRGTNAVGVTAGAGVGLAGVRQIVEQHGGAVWATSVEGSGSTFTIRLPLQFQLSGNLTR